MDYAVRVDIEGDLDLRYPARRRSDAFKVERAKRPVLRGKFPLSLQHMDGYSCLAIGGCGEDLALAGRDRRVPLDQLRADSAKRLDSKRERSDIEKKDILYIALEDTALYGGAYGDDLIRIDALVRLLAEELLHQSLYSRDPGGSADEDDLVNAARGDAGVPERVLARDLRPLDDRGDHLLELSP